MEVNPFSQVPNCPLHLILSHLSAWDAQALRRASPAVYRRSKTHLYWRNYCYYQGLTPQQLLALSIESGNSDQTRASLEMKADPWGNYHLVPKWRAINFRDEYYSKQLTSETALFWFCLYNHQEQAQLILDSLKQSIDPDDIQINDRIQAGLEASLLVSLTNGHITLARSLVSHIKQSISDEKWYVILKATAGRGLVAGVMLLWDHGKILNKEDLLKSSEVCLDLLEQAVDAGRYDMTRYLLQLEEFQTIDLDNVLRVAVNRRHYRLVQLLYPRRKTLSRPTLFKLAAQANHLPLVRWLYQQMTISELDQAIEADPKYLYEILNLSSVPIGDFILSLKRWHIDGIGIINSRRRGDMTTPLVTACITGNYERVKLYLDHGALVSGHELYRTSYRGFIIQQEWPFLLALSRGHCRVVKLLVERGANPHVFGPDNRPNYPLHVINWLIRDDELQPICKNLIRIKQYLLSLIYHSGPASCPL